MSGNVLFHDCIHHTRTLPLLTDLEASYEANYRGLGLFIIEAMTGTHNNARWVSVHEVDVCISLGKIVPLGRLHEFL
jgi:hypothetical protein